MTEYFAGSYDVAVIGAGHAGIEAALAAARLGASTIIFTLSLDAVGNLPCNPSIGGTAKGHLVREIDALGGEMGRAADATLIQSRMLNRGKGPAVHSLRAQVDRDHYRRYMKAALEAQPNLAIKQAEVTDLRLAPDGSLAHVCTRYGALYEVGAAIIATGTYLGGRVYVGDSAIDSGPDGLQSTRAITDVLRGMGVALRRFKTGTPARVRRGSIDFARLEPQPGDTPIVPFSFETTDELTNLVDCHITYTNAQTHEIIRQNLHLSPMYGESALIEGTGTRYCPSIEDKIVRFADKPRHQIFIEPVGLETQEMYLQGLSSSLPEQVQVELYRSIEGLANAEIMRTAYAIEYDCIDPTQLDATLQFKSIPGLYGAGQFNGTSGYEEAAAQGLVAGINAVRCLRGQAPLTLPRSQSYIGTLIDDLVTKGCADPYRMMTSRSEYRLLLRQDNADARLTPLGFEVGLISQQRYDAFCAKQRAVEAELARVGGVVLSPKDELNEFLAERGTSPVQSGVRLCDLIRRPELSYTALARFDPARRALPEAVAEQVEILIKYEGYIQRQRQQVAEAERLESLVIPGDIDYHSLAGLRLEAREKLSRIRPSSVGQAGRVSGVSPADITVLIIYLKQRGRGADE